MWQALEGRSWGIQQGGERNVKLGIRGTFTGEQTREKRSSKVKDVKVTSSSFAGNTTNL